MVIKMFTKLENGIAEFREKFNNVSKYNKELSIPEKYN